MIDEWQWLTCCGRRYNRHRLRSPSRAPPMPPSRLHPLASFSDTFSSPQNSSLSSQCQLSRKGSETRNSECACTFLQTSPLWIPMSTLLTSPSTLARQPLQRCEYCCIFESILPNHMPPSFPPGAGNKEVIIDNTHRIPCVNRNAGRCQHGQNLSLPSIYLSPSCSHPTPTYVYRR
jgi:hypothetical protein